VLHEPAHADRLGVETIGLPLPGRLPQGTNVEIAISGGWVIPRQASAAKLHKIAEWRAGEDETGNGYIIVGAV
jgi:hypothetical protein